MNDDIQSAIPEIMARVRREAEQQIERRCLEVVMQEATGEAQKWAKEVLAPEIRAQLDAGKAGMVAKAQNIADSLTAAVSEALVAQVKKNLSQSWNVKKAIEAIVGN